MMTIKMLRNERGSEDGFTVKFYEKDQSYDVAASLGTSFVRTGAAERTGGDDLEVDPASVGVQAAAPVKANGEARPVYEAGQVYEDNGTISLAIEKASGDGVHLVPVQDLTEAERAQLVTDGKLTTDGKPVEQKSQPGAPQNKAVKGAPQNKGR